MKPAYVRNRFSAGARLWPNLPKAASCS